MQEKYNKLQGLSNDIRENNIPRVKNKLQSAQQSATRFKQDIQSHIKTVLQQSEYLKELIERSTSETVSQLEDVEKEITKQHNQFKSDSETVIQLLEDLLTESTEAIKSDNNILIVDVEEHASSLNIPEPDFVCNVVPMKFIQGSNPESNIKTALGTIVYELQSQSVQTQIEPVISKLVDLSIVPWSIQRQQTDELLVRGLKKDDPLTRINKDGSATTLTLDTPLYDICLDPVSDQLYCTPFVGTNIKSVDTQSGKTTDLITTKTNPVCLNLTRNGQIFMVGSSDKCEVTLYDRKGTLLQTVTTVRYPFHIAVCRYTGRVAIACGSGGVMVMENKADRLQHIYTYPTTTATINASDAEFDDAGHLLVVDYTTKTVHVTDSTTGKTLKGITVDGLPMSLTTMKNGDIVLGTRDPNQLLNIKY